MTLDLTDKRWVGPGHKKKKKKPIPTKSVLSKRKRKIFLQTLARTGKVKHSAQMAGYQDSKTLRMVRLKDEEFSQAWDDASDAAADIMEDEAMRRATEGVMEPEYYKGGVVGHKVKYSDTLLQFLLKGARPDKFRDNIKVDATLNGAIGVAVLPMVAPSDEDWEKQTLEMHKSQKPVELVPLEDDPHQPSLAPPEHTTVEVARG